MNSHQRILSILTLSKPEYRLGFFAAATLVIFVVPYEFLDRAKLSLYERMHIPSPSIGLTRAYWRVIHGDFRGAWERNKLIYLVLAVWVCIMIFDVYAVFSKHRASKKS
jgi:predicted PurR-regulated permease PerM